MRSFLFGDKFYFYTIFWSKGSKLFFFFKKIYYSNFIEKVINKLPLSYEQSCLQYRSQMDAYWRMTWLENQNEFSYFEKGNYKLQKLSSWDRLFQNGSPNHDGRLDWLNGVWFSEFLDALVLEPDSSSLISTTFFSRRLILSSFSDICIAIQLCSFFNRSLLRMALAMFLFFLSSRPLLFLSLVECLPISGSVW